MTSPYAYFDKYDEDDFKIKKANRRRKVDERKAFMILNGNQLKTTILPLLAKKARESRKKNDQ